MKSSPLLSDFFEFMEGRGWVLTLSEGADILHSKDNDGLIKRAELKESSKQLGTSREKPSSQPKKVKQDSIATSVLRSRPILRDILNDSK